MNNPNLRALWRFKMLVACGLAAAACAPIFMVYRVVDVGPPPKFVARDQVSQVAQAQILVDSPSSPYLRTTQREVIPTQTPDGSDARSKPAIVELTDPATLVASANLFPLLIMSDEIAVRRYKAIGPIPGSVTAKSLHSFQGNNRFRPAVLPVIQVQAIAPTARDAAALAQGTVDAFDRWLRQRQVKSGVSPEHRIVLRQLNSALGTAEIGGPSYSLPLLAAAMIFFAFCGLAIMLDRARPVRQRVVSPPAETIPRLSRVETDGDATDAANTVSENGSHGVIAGRVSGHVPDTH